MKPYELMWPTFVLVALTFVVLFAVMVTRGAHMKRQPPAAGDFADNEATARYFRPVEAPANNLRNLFELPMLYYALVALALILHQNGRTQVALAWAFVLLRVVHSIAHVVVPRVAVRAVAFWLSALVLAVMWGGLLFDVYNAANTAEPFMV